MQERRRSPRHPVAGQSMALPIQESVRLLDLNSMGVLLHTSSAPDLGARARLRFSLGGEPLATDVEVRRVSATPGGFRVGARFVEMSPLQRRLIERFMSS